MTEDEFKSALAELNNGLGVTNSGLGLYGDIRRGGVEGGLGATVNAGNLYRRLTGSQVFSPYTSALGSILGLYSGIQSGGAAGDTQAALSAARLGLQGATATGALSGAAAAPYVQGLGYAAIPLQLYNFAKNWKSGDTGSDALSGAETGASIGSYFGPIGALAGLLIGGAGGALSSAFGAGKYDPENLNWNSFVPQYNKLSLTDQQRMLSGLTPLQDVQLLQGVMDAKDPTPGHSEELEQKFGRMQGSSVISGIANQINDAVKNGQIIQNPDGSITFPGAHATYMNPSDAASEVYQQIVDPWLSSQGVQLGYTAPGKEGYVVNTNQTEGGALEGILKNLTGDYLSGELTPSSRVGVSGQTVAGLPAYAGLPAPSPNPMARFASVRPIMGAGSVGAKLFSQGGIMKKRRKTRFDDGGSFDDLQEIEPSATYLSDFDLGPDYSDLGSGLVDIQPDFSEENYYNLPSVYTDPGDSNSSGGGAGALSSLLQTLGLGANTASMLGKIGVGAAELSPLLSALFGGGNNNNGTPPPIPEGYGSIPSIPTPNFSRGYTGPTTSSWNPEKWYTYGQGPEQTFFSNNQLPYVPGVSPSGAAPQTRGNNAQIRPVMAQGGALDHALHDGPGYVEDPGYGDGTSDDVNAKLSGGEYVMDGGTVSLLGNGSNEAGARKLDELRERIRREAGKHLVKGKQFMRAKEPEAYLKGSERRTSKRKETDDEE